MGLGGSGANPSEVLNMPTNGMCGCVPQFYRGVSIRITYIYNKKKSEENGTE